MISKRRNNDISPKKSIIGKKKTKKGFLKKLNFKKKCCMKGTRNTKKRRMSKRTKKQKEAWVKFVKGVLKRYKKNDKYTPEEKEFERILESLGLKKGVDFFHNYRVKQPNGYFWLDFYFPNKRVDFEIDGKIWHLLNPERDKRRDEFLRKEGVEIIRIDSSNLRNKKNLDEIREKVKSIIFQYKIN